MAQHDQHAQLAKPGGGDFHTREWALIGAPCSVIQDLAARLIPVLLPHYQLAYVDADHAAADQAEHLQPQGAAAVFTDKINYHRIEASAVAPWLRRTVLTQQADGALLNGNHFEGQKQIVILDPRKAESLERKLNRLTNVALLLTTNEQPLPYDFLRRHLDGRMPQTMPLGDINGIAQWLRAQLTAAVPEVYGLLLAGGKSSRMGEDKSLLQYHGQPQYLHLQQLMGAFCKEVVLSQRPGQAPLPYSGPVLEDSFIGLGPMGAMLSAFKKHPDKAWLVVACDLPLLDAEALRYLLERRNPSKLATAFHSNATGFPDPLVTLWEPRAYAALLQFLAQGYSCPRKVLINTDIQLLHYERQEVLANANTPEERETILQQLQKH